MITFKQFLLEQPQKYLPGKKYNGHIPEIRYVRVDAIDRPLAQDGHEVLTVSDEVAKSMDFSEPIEVTVYRFGGTKHPDDDQVPIVSLVNGHHRTAAALQTGRSWLPAVATARNALGEKINSLIEISDKIEKSK